MAGALIYDASMGLERGLGFGEAAARDPDYVDVARFQEGNEAAFEALVTKREREIYLLTFRLLGDREEALDAVQEVFLRAYRSLKSFRCDATFRTWLTGIAINVCRNKHASASDRNRRNTVSLTREDPEDGEITQTDLPDCAPGPEASVLGHELRAALESALDRIAPEHREILILREIQDMEYEELADVLGCPVGTVKSRLCRARQALRTAMEGVWP